MADATHLVLDGAWPHGVLGLPELDATEWGPRLRYVAPRALVAQFEAEVTPRLAPFVLYGSGDYHFLSGVLVRRAAAAQTPITLVSFDNHPDWDVRPPYWSCGGWAARASRDPCIAKVSVWGCGNFELRFPARTFADRRALREGRLAVHAWAERQTRSVRTRFDCMSRGDWRGRFGRFAASLAGAEVYVTVDLDCLADGEAVTNWESGLFTAAEVADAIRTLRAHSNVVAGDVCGAWSEPRYERRGQRFAGRWDHPKLPRPDRDRARELNVRALETIWPALTGA
jgi:arginase family enzyme